MKRIITILAIITMMFSYNAHAFDIVDVNPDDSFIASLGRDVEADKEYIRGIANSYNEKFVVTKEKYVDISSIDSFFKRLSTPLSITELDAGKTEIQIDKIRDSNYRKQLNDFKILGGMAGYSVEFEAIAYFNIYRNISLVGGYIQYYKTHADPYEAYWQYICNIEELTKEVVPYDTRLKLVDRFEKLSDFMDNDKTFKIFILKDGQIDSLFERGEGS